MFTMPKTKKLSAFGREQMVRTYQLPSNGLPLAISQGGYERVNYNDNPKIRTVTYPVIFPTYNVISFAILETSEPADKHVSVYSQQRSTINFGYVLSAGSNYKVNWISCGI